MRKNIGFGTNRRLACAVATKQKTVVKRNVSNLRWRNKKCNKHKSADKTPQSQRYENSKICADAKTERLYKKAKNSEKNTKRLQIQKRNDYKYKNETTANKNTKRLQIQTRNDCKYKNETTANTKARANLLAPLCCELQTTPGNIPTTAT